MSWDAQAADFKEAVESLSNVEEVEVTKDQWTDDTGYDFYRWTVRIDRPFVRPPEMLRFQPGRSNLSVISRVSPVIWPPAFYKFVDVVPPDTRLHRLNIGRKPMLPDGVHCSC